MLKIIATLTLFFFGMLAKSQVVENRNTTAFSKVEVANGIELIYTENPSFSMQVATTDQSILKNIITEVNGKTLKIYVAKGTEISANDMVKVYLSTQNIESLKAVSKAKITIVNQFNAKDMDLVLTSGATFSGNIKASGKTKFTVKDNALFNGKIETATLNGNFRDNSKINLTGNAQNATFHTEDTAFLSARNFIANAIDLNAVEKSNVVIYANNKIAVNVTDEARVSYTGFPQEIVMNEEAEAFKKCNNNQLVTYNDMRN